MVLQHIVYMKHITYYIYKIYNIIHIIYNKVYVLLKHMLVTRIEHFVFQVGH